MELSPCKPSECEERIGEKGELSGIHLFLFNYLYNLCISLTNDLASDILTSVSNEHRAAARRSRHPLLRLQKVLRHEVRVDLRAVHGVGLPAAISGRSTPVVNSRLQLRIGVLLVEGILQRVPLPHVFVDLYFLAFNRVYVIFLCLPSHVI